FDAGFGSLFVVEPGVQAPCEGVSGLQHTATAGRQKLIATEEAGARDRTQAGTKVQGGTSIHGGLILHRNREAGCVGHQTPPPGIGEETSRATRRVGWY